MEWQNDGCGRILGNPQEGLERPEGGHTNKFQKEKEKEMDAIRDAIAENNAHSAPTYEVAGTLVESLPEEICTLTKARRLLITHNFRLTSLPDTFGDLYERLEILNLSYNALQSFPLELCRLKYLQRLEMNNNNITCLPTRISQMRTLEYLCLDSNFLQVLPFTVPHMKALKTLYLENNPLLEESTQRADAIDYDTMGLSMDPSTDTCSVTGEPLGDKLYHFVNFVDVANNKRCPVHYVCATEEDRDRAIEDKDKEYVDYWELKYTTS